MYANTLIHSKKHTQANTHTHTPTFLTVQYFRTKENFNSKSDWKKLDVKPFLMSETPITNEKFAKFVKEHK